MKTVRWVVKCKSGILKFTTVELENAIRYVKSVKAAHPLTNIAIYRITTTTTEEKVEWEKDGEAK